MRNRSSTDGRGARKIAAAALIAAMGCAPLTALAQGPDKATMIREALSAAPPSIAKTATVMGWDHAILRPGTSAYTCMPTPPELRVRGLREPMCLDKVWMEWADAWMNKKPFRASGVGIAYMLAGDAGASNTDPYATAKTATNQWVVEGPHVMILVPDPAALAGYSDDPNNGGPYVMWKGTPYAHIMMPVGPRPTAR